jgi:putative ABC transport system substrate-binding protein
VGQTIWHDASEPKSGEADAVPAKAHVGDAAFTTMAQKRVPAFLIIADPLFTSRRVQLVTLAARHAIPAIYTSREFAEVGGLMSYGVNLPDIYRQVSTYTGRILKGANTKSLKS